MTHIQVGQTAPEFSLYDSDKKMFTLSEHRGHNVLLLFFPFAFSSVCTAELCLLQENLNIYEGLNALLIAI